jgi:hypothetical protein
LVEIFAGFAGFIEIGGGESPGGRCVGSVRGELQHAKAGETQDSGKNKKSEDIIFHECPWKRSRSEINEHLDETKDFNYLCATGGV